MTAVYDNLGIHFLYPENWVATDEVDAAWPRSVSVQGPSGAFWSVTIHLPPADPEELAGEVLGAMREEYEALEAHPASETIGDVPCSGYDLYFDCVDVIVAAQVRAFRLGVRSFVMFCQAEDHEFDRLRLVFRAMTESLLRPEENGPD